jgi:methionine synthase I (cobalamin-dependent)
LSAVAGNKAADVTMTDPSASTRTVLAFYEHAVKQRDFAAAAHYLAPVLIQHRRRRRRRRWVAGVHRPDARRLPARIAYG